MIFNLQNKKIFLTGGTGGIGSALIDGFLKNGSHVCFSSSSNEKIEKLYLEKQNIKQNDQILHGEVCDMNDFVMIGETSKKILEKMNNEIDVLICNAGTNLDKLAMRMDMSDWMKVINTNLNGNFKLISEFLRSMTSRKKGRIILISSVIASMGNMGQANYAASKAGLEGMMRCLAIETSRYNVTINAIAPGFIETPMTEKLPEQIKEAMLKRIPMNRYGKPEEIFNTVAFLSSDESSYITGQTIHVNGGMYFN